MSVWWIALGVVVLAGLGLAFAPFRGPRRAWEVEDRTDLDRLFEEKGRILRGIKDLDHERSAGLTSEADWRESRAEHVAAAVRLNREIAARTGVDPRTILRTPSPEPSEAERIA